MRKEIEDLGGEVRFGCRVTDLLTDRGQIRGVSYEQRQTADRVEEQELRTDVVVLAIGHSARDTFSMLKEKGIPMQAKSFAVGVRMEHPQHMINESQYGKDYPAILPAAAYKVTRQTGGGKRCLFFLYVSGGMGGQRFFRRRTPGSKWYELSGKRQPECQQCHDCYGDTG